MENEKSQSDDRGSELVEPVAPATPDGRPPYTDPAPDELDLSAQDRSLRDAGSGESGTGSSGTEGDV